MLWCVVFRPQETAAPAPAATAPPPAATPASAAGVYLILRRRTAEKKARQGCPQQGCLLVKRVSTCQCVCCIASNLNSAREHWGRVLNCCLKPGVWWDPGSCHQQHHGDGLRARAGELVLHAGFEQGYQAPATGPQHGVQVERSFGLANNHFPCCECRWCVP